MAVVAAILWLPLVVLFVAPSALAGDAVAQPQRTEVQQKLQLVKMLVGQPSPAERTTSNDGQNPQAAKSVRTLYIKANDAFVAGNMMEADVLLNEALSLVESAAEMEQTEDRQRTRYAELLEDVRASEATYQDVRKGLSAKGIKPYDVEAEHTHELINRAQALVRDSKYLEASELLEKVHGVYISILNNLLASTEFVYDNKFKSPAEEFNHELARYRSYEELIPIAHAKYKSDEGVVKLSDRYVQEGRAARDLAEKQALGGDYPSAIGTLQVATKGLQTALRVIGLEVPE